jgi:hypothetical protein
MPRVLTALLLSRAGAGLSEAERLAAAKSTKDQLGKGISLFNSKGPLKGLDFLMSQGLLESSPAAVSRASHSFVWPIHVACLRLVEGPMIVLRLCHSLYAVDTVLSTTGEACQ